MPDEDLSPEDRTLAEATVRFLLKHMPKAIVKKLPREDWYQCGYMGIWKARKKYDPSRGVAKFETYLNRCVRNQMLDELARLAHRSAHVRKTLGEEIVNGLDEYPTE